MAYLNPTVRCLQETLYIQDTNRLKAKKKKKKKSISCKQQSQESQDDYTNRKNRL